MDATTLQALFGRRIRSLRKERGLTQEELAEATRLSAEYISRVERGLASPSFKIIARLADTLGVTPGVFFDFKEGK